MTLTKEETDFVNNNVAKSIEQAEQYQRILLLLRNIQLYIKNTRHKLLCPEEYDFKQLEEISYTGEALEKMSASLADVDDRLFMLAYSFNPTIAEHFSDTIAKQFSTIDEGEV